MTTGSWNLKLDRAEKHLVELGELIDNYVDGHFYRAVCTHPPKRKPSHWRFTLDITKQPDPEIAIVLGDLLYNVRSALDHIAVAIAPKHRKSSAGFPLVNSNTSERDRETFARHVADMPPEAVALIERHQPYNFNLDAEVPGRMFTLAGLSALQNADKHRNLAVLAAGLSDPYVTVRWQDEALSFLMPTYLEPGAEVVSHKELGNVIPYPEVQVEVSGTPEISVVVGGRHGYPLTKVVTSILIYVRRNVIYDLEAFV